MIMKQYYLKKDDIYLFFNVFKKDPNLKNFYQLFRFYQCFKIDINKIIFKNLSILHIRQNVETMKILIDYGGDINNRNIMNITPIMVQYNYDCIKYLYDKGAELYNEDLYYGFNILFWQKSPRAMEFLLEKGLSIHKFHNLFYTKDKYINNIYIQLFIEGGYDPYYQTYLSVSPLFLQKDIQTQEIMLYHFNESFSHIDLFAETPLFKTSVTVDLIKLYLNYGENINNQNLFLNTLLHIHFEPNIILFLLQNNANITIRNINNETPYIHHFKKKNFIICDLIKKYYSSTLIQRNWLRFIFQKKYIPPKNYQLKKKLITNIEYLPSSLCNKFKGGIQYQKLSKIYKLT